MAMARNFSTVPAFQSPFLETFKILPWDTYDEGAIGTVFKVERIRGKKVFPPIDGINFYPDGSQFIVKLVDLPSSGTENTSSSQMREVELLKANEIDHVNVIKIFGSWEEHPPKEFKYPERKAVKDDKARILFILMEYCDLFSLHRWLGWPRERKSWNDMLNLFLQITKGLECIHQRRIIHRDLKPANIGLKCDWEEETVVAKLIDFGLATEIREFMTSTRAGTHLYLSPERHRHGKAYDEKADVYTLGIILCQMMSSLWAKDASAQKLEEDFRDFMVESMDSTMTPLPFDSYAYLRKYDVEETKISNFEKQVLHLAADMTSKTPQSRPSSAEILSKIRTMCPEIESTKVSIYNYLEELKERQVGLSAMNFISLRPIKTSRLNHLTHLTLKNIQMKKMELHEICRECVGVTYLSLSLSIPDLKWNELLPMKSMPKLKTFRFRIHDNPDNSRLPTPHCALSEHHISRVQSCLFFGPMSQIWANEMRVKFSIGKRPLIDVQAGGVNLSCSLQFIEGGFEFMELLNHRPFTNVSLDRLLGKSPQDNLDLDSLWSLEKRNDCLKLYLSCRSIVDYKGGRLFQAFNCLQELTVFGNYSTFPFKVIRFDVLPQTLTKLVMKWIQPEVDGMIEAAPRKLKTLKLSLCEVPGSFYENYEALFEVEFLRVSCVMGGSDVVVIPGFSYVETFLNTSNWKEVTLDPFDWKETPENSEFRSGFIADFFLQENEESLEDQGIVLKWIDGNPVAILLTDVQFTDRSKSVANALSTLHPVDTDDEEDADLMIQQSIIDFLSVFDRRKNVDTVTDGFFDNESPENYYFKGTLTSPTYPQRGWESEITFENFNGITLKPKALLKHIKLQNCKVNSLGLQLRGCKKLQTLVLEMVHDIQANKLTPNFPDLKTYSVNLYDRHLFGGLHANVFTYESLDQLFFFRQPPERMKGLWGSGTSCTILVQGSSFFEITESSLSLEFLPELERILKLLELNVSLLTLKVHCCLFCLSPSMKMLLPKSITKLILKYVSILVTDISPEEFPNLNTLVFEGHDFEDIVDLKKLEKLSVSLKHLTLCNVSLYDITETENCKLGLESLTLNRVSILDPLRKAFFNSRNFKALVLADIAEKWCSLETLHLLLVTEKTTFFPGLNVTFINYVKDPVDDGGIEPRLYTMEEMLPVCQSYLEEQCILLNDFRIYLDLESQTAYEFKAVQISPDEVENDPLLEGYRETRPFFPKNDIERHRKNFTRLWDRLTHSQNSYPAYNGYEFYPSLH